METAAAAASCCSSTPRFQNKPSNYYYQQSSTPKTNKKLCWGSSLSLTFPGNFNFPGKSQKLCKTNTITSFTVFSSLSDSDNQNPSPEFAILLEVDGVLMDAYRLGNRQAFNVAFRKLGLDCANWTQPVYQDLLRKCSGDEERMVILYFNRIGWPASLPTSEKGTFVKNVLREKKIALDEFVISDGAPLRPGAEDFIDDAIKDGVPVAILTAYGKSEEKVTRSIVDKLGQERISKIKVIGTKEAEQSLYGQLVLGQNALTGVDEELANEARKAVSSEKQRIAGEVASLLKVSVNIEATSSESVDKIVAALRAGAEYAGLPVDYCVLIAGSQIGVCAAERIGMPCVVLRSSLTSRAEFRSVKAVMDGFGGADLTIPKLRHKLLS